jgi:transcription antitermination factor NusG
MTENWYALHSQSRKEDLLWHQLEIHGIETFYPRIRVRPVNPRARKVKPYFPGYLFIHADLTVSGLSVFQWMPYATGVVIVGGEPAIVPDNLIYAIRFRINEIAEAGGELFDGLKSGDTVHISDGPFSGYEGIFDTRLPGSERVRVLLKMLNQRILPIELNASQIQKMKTTSARKR